ncbi:late competence protein ComER [Pontibacillus yanchengensis]|uniref:Late competence protein ComER n=1 Tax=Pontibacillus yanchengensis TaxID=462910 RepID=A0A6I4ZZT1_9BACI|nr:late competence protein ComER [Pontibacillus yanchengensis]MYL33403.1 late competence protein ComER [Pontibacillus yanchengensis]
MKWGIIGTGNMGRILMEAWLDSGMIQQSDLYITNRSLKKAVALKDYYPEINVIHDPATLAQKVDVLFICVKPLDIYPLLTDIQSQLTEKHCLVSITSPYSVEELEKLVPCQVARIIPSITNRARTGVSLMTFGTRIDPVMKAYIQQSVKLYSRPLEINEAITRVSSDIVSCGPAFFSYIIQRFVQAACEETDITNEDATTMITEMLIGFGKLIEEGYYSLSTLQAKVCVKGGVTGEGIQILEEEIGDMFHHLFQKTHKKYQEDKREISNQLND